MKTVAAYSMLGETHVPLSRLHSAGIEAELRDECIIWVDWFNSNAVGGVKIVVPDEDFLDACAIVRMPPLEAGILACPDCGSSDLFIRPLSIAAAVFIMFKLPIPIRLHTFDCHRCNKTHHIVIRD